MLGPPPASSMPPGSGGNQDRPQAQRRGSQPSVQQQQPNLYQPPFFGHGVPSYRGQAANPNQNPALASQPFPFAGPDQFMPASGLYNSYPTNSRQTNNRQEIRQSAPPVGRYSTGQQPPQQLRGQSQPVGPNNNYYQPQQQQQQPRVYPPQQRHLQQRLPKGYPPQPLYQQVPAGAPYQQQRYPQNGAYPSPVYGSRPAQYAGGRGQAPCNPQMAPQGVIQKQVIRRSQNLPAGATIQAGRTVKISEASRSGSKNDKKKDDTEDERPKAMRQAQKTGFASRILGKLVELHDTTTGMMTGKVEGIIRGGTSGDFIQPPPRAFLAKLHEPLTKCTIFCLDEIEYLYYVFRNLCDPNEPAVTTVSPQKEKDGFVFVSETEAEIKIDFERLMAIFPRTMTPTMKKYVHIVKFANVFKLDAQQRVSFSSFVKLLSLFTSDSPVHFSIVATLVSDNDYCVTPMSLAQTCKEMSESRFLIPDPLPPCSSSACEARRWDEEEPLTWTDDRENSDKLRSHRVGVIAAEDGAERDYDVTSSRIDLDDETECMPEKGTDQEDGTQTPRLERVTHPLDKSVDAFSSLALVLGRTANVNARSFKEIDLSESRLQRWLSTTFQDHPDLTMSSEDFVSMLLLHTSSIPGETASDTQFDDIWEALAAIFGLVGYIRETVLSTMRWQLRHATCKGSPAALEKEGVLSKSWSALGYERWKPHWCRVAGGFFWYYSPDNKYLTAERVLSLHRASLASVEDNKPECFQISVPGGYIRKFAAESATEANSWKRAIMSQISQGQQFDSFAPPRRGVDTRWYVDGKDAFAAILSALRHAKKEIFITDWFMSTKIYLQRHDSFGMIDLADDYRLDVILRQKAREGVRVFVLPWNETKIAMDLGSQMVKEELEALHPNIRVICHPLMSPVKWSHHQKTVIVDQQVAFLGGLDLCYGRYDDSDHVLTDNGNTKIWPGKDYYNPVYCEMHDAHRWQEDTCDRNHQARMGWHDVHMSVNGDAARDVAANFIQRWNHHKEVLTLSTYPYIVPDTYTTAPTHGCQCQIVRSISDWSAGLGRLKEKSIYNAYLHIIDMAEHFIYIENQFFISSLAGGVVRNRIAEKILNKLCDAIRDKKTFRVVILLPVHPEGGVFKETASVRYIMKWQLDTIISGKDSIMANLKREFPDVQPEEYITFQALRNYGFLGKKLCTEQIYVHAKFLAVDDRIAVIGSANINDRSMFGCRDSEIAGIVWGGESVNITMNGEAWKASKFVHDLRLNLWLEHLDLDESWKSALADPISEAAYHNIWLRTAKGNTDIYDKIFQEERSGKFSKNIEADIQRIKGHLVMFDLDITDKHDLGVGITDLDVAFTSSDVFT